MIYDSICSIFIIPTVVILQKMNMTKCLIVLEV